MSQAGLLSTKNIPPPPGSITDLEGQDGVVVPPNGAGIIFVRGAVVAAGTVPFTTTGNAGTSTETWNIQISQAIAASNATNIGLAAFNSAFFTVDANGYVSLVSGSVVEKFTVDANTAPGTNPVVPTAAGIVTITGGQVAAGTTTNVIQTNSLAANTYTIQIQRSQAVASSTIGDNGVSHFNSGQFTVDANGFVSLSGSAVGETITGDSGGALSPTAGNWNILGRSGSKTSGSGSTLTINSPPFSQVGASATSVLNSGEFVTAAVTRTLPATAGLLDGDLVIYYCTTTGALVVTANTGQTIRIGTLVSSSGGTATSTNVGDTITLRFDATAVSWRAVSVIGTWVMA